MSYSENSGKYQKEFEILLKEIPESGESYDTRVELMRIACNLSYDMYQNGMENCTKEGSRNEEYKILSSKVDMGYVGTFMDQLQEDVDNDVDYEDRKSEDMIEKGVKEFDKVIDRVIEKIIEMNYDFGEKK